MDPRLITVQYSTTCLTCEEQIEAGEKAWWVKDVGSWHQDCHEPRNLAQYQRDKARGVT